LQSKKILFFHKYEPTTRYCRRILGKEYELIDAVLGEDGVARAGGCGPDMVLIDLEDGIEAGLELCGRMTADPDTQEIPVMVLYTRGDRNTVEKAMAAGAVDYSSKPLIPALFAKRVQTTIERYADKLPHCPGCRRPMRPEWSFCPYDGEALARGQSS